MLQLKVAPVGLWLGYDRKIMEKYCGLKYSKERVSKEIKKPFSSGRVTSSWVSGALNKWKLSGEIRA